MKACPPRPELRRFLTNQLDSAAEGSLLAHIEECALCQKTLEEMTSAEATQTYQRAASLPDALSSKFGRYRLLRLLGTGGMGAVYLAHDTQLDRSIALKIPHLRDKDRTDVLARFYREARAAARVVHPNICPVYDVGEIDGKAYLTMRFLAGSSLSKLIAASPLTVRQSVVLVHKLALALHEAHNLGVIHRDLKPANIMIDCSGQPIIMDFGLARCEQDARLTQSGVIVGTPGYLSPEQANGEVEEPGPACDLYALGVILYQLLAGRLPFNGEYLDILLQIVNEDPPPVEQFCPAVDPALAAICHKAIARKKEDRFASMADLAQALADYLRAKPSVAVQATRAADFKPTVPPRFSRTVRVLTWLAGVSALGLTVGLGGRLLVHTSNQVTNESQLDLNSPGPEGTRPSEPEETGREELQNLHFQAHIESVSFSADSRTCLIATHNRTYLYDIQTGKQLMKTFNSKCAEFLPTGSKILFQLNAPKPRFFRIYDLASAKERTIPSQGVVSRLHVIPHSDRFLAFYSGSHGHDRICLINYKNGKVVREWTGESHKAAALCSPDGKYFLMQLDGRLPWKAYTENTGAEDTSFSKIAAIANLEAIFFENQRVAALSGNTLRFYEISTGNELGKLDLGKSPIEGDAEARPGDLVALSPDEQRVLTAHQDHQIRLWDLTTGSELDRHAIHDSERVKHLAFTPDGSRACAVATDGRFYLWRLPRN
jgi:serine/threonine protein kinase